MVKRGLTISSLVCSWPILYPFVLVPMLTFGVKKVPLSLVLTFHVFVGYSQFSLQFFHITKLLQSNSSLFPF